jgi:hypothetical protein
MNSEHAMTFPEVLARIEELSRELVAANDAGDWPRFLRADEELARVCARRAELLAAATETEARRARLTAQFTALAAQAAAPLEDAQCRLF